MEIKVTTKKPPSFYTRSVATFLRGTEEKDRVEELVVTGLGNAVGVAASVVQQTTGYSKLAKVTEIRTAYLNLNSIMCPQISFKLCAHRPLALLVAFEVKNDCVDEFLQVMNASANASRAEVGCLRFDLLQDQGNPCKFTCYEAYESDAALEVHKEMPYVKAWGAFQYGEKKPIVSKSVTKLDAVDFQVGMSSMGSTSPTAVVLQVSIKNEHIDEFVKIMTADAKGSRTEKACRRFDLLRSAEKPSEFVCYEAFDSQEALDLHKEMKYVKDWGAFQYGEKKPVESKSVLIASALNFTG